MLGRLTNLRVLCTQIKTEQVFTWIQSERKQCDRNCFPFFSGVKSSQIVIQPKMKRVFKVIIFINLPIIFQSLTPEKTTSHLSVNTVTHLNCCFVRVKVKYTYKYI